MPSLFPVSPFTRPYTALPEDSSAVEAGGPLCRTFLCVVTERVMNQCCQPHCHHFLGSKYNVCPETVALKKSKWLVKHFLSWFSFFRTTECL